MAGRSDPPEGIPPEGLPNSGDDDYRSVVFDESFVRAARLQEFSASERAGDHAPAVRTLSPAPAPAVTGNGHKQVFLMMLLVVLALCAAVYMGVRSPVLPVFERHPEALRATVVPLAPAGRVPGGEPAELFLHSPAAQFRTGAEGIQLPVARSTPHFSESQVLAALTIAKDYLVQSSVDPGVLTGGSVRPVRLLLDPDQQEQFDASFARSGAGGPGPASASGLGNSSGSGSGTRTAAGGWMVRFDPDKVALAGAARANGTLRAIEIGPDILDVSTDHTFVYPLRPATRPGRGSERADSASLFTVRRELHFRYDAEDLRRHRTELLDSYAVGGPQACGATTGAPPFWQPLLAGGKAPATAPDAGAPSGVPAGTDPYATGTPTGSVCGILAPAAMPTPSRADR
ncbi:SCO2583 family membrane protein [Streptomyces sp. NPDC054863]